MTEITTPAATATPAEGILSIDGVEYPMANLSEQSRQLLANVRATDAEIGRLRQMSAICQTARMAFLQALKAELNKA